MFSIRPVSDQTVFQHGGKHLSWELGISQSTKVLCFNTKVNILSWELGMFSVGKLLRIVVGEWVVKLIT